MKGGLKNGRSFLFKNFLQFVANLQLTILKLWYDFYKLRLSIGKNVAYMWS